LLLPFSDPVAAFFSDPVAGFLALLLAFLILKLQGWPWLLFFYPLGGRRRMKG
jgi:hypothetical protein